jgi:catechol 2,3-dioxygenase-like lactoylglutathione lyase family enzyme
MRFTIDRIDHIVLNVTSVEISAAWYQRVLGMEREDFGDNRTALKFGGQKINLRPVDADLGAWPTGVCTEAGAGDVCFITAIPPDEVIGHLHDCGVQILQGPVTKTGALGAIRSVYCRDPDGNLVEISSYQP